MYDADHSGTWLRGRLDWINISRRQIVATEKMMYLLPSKLHDCESIRWRAVEVCNDDKRCVGTFVARLEGDVTAVTEVVTARIDKGNREATTRFATSSRPGECHEEGESGRVKSRAGRHHVVARSEFCCGEPGRSRAPRQAGALGAKSCFQDGLSLARKAITINRSSPAIFRGRPGQLHGP